MSFLFQAGLDHADSGGCCFFLLFSPHFCRGHLLCSLCGDGCVAVLWVCFHPPRVNCLLVWSVFRLGNGLSWVKDWTSSAARVSMLWSLLVRGGLHTSLSAIVQLYQVEVCEGGGGGGDTVQNGFKVSSGYKFGVMLSNGYNGWDYIEKTVKGLG